MYCSLAVYLLLFSASYCLHSPITASGKCYSRSMCIEFRSMIQTSCTNSLLWHGLNFRQWGVPCNWSVAKKTGSMYIRRRWSLWTLAVTFLAWHSSCHTSQLVFLQSHQCHPTTSSFQSHKDLKEYNKPSVRWKSLAFYKLVWWHFQMGNLVTVCFLLR